MTPLRVIVAEDQAPAREHLASLLTAYPDVEVVAVCSDGPSAIQAIRAHGADVVLLDIQMPECSGFDVAKIVGVDRMPPIIFITAYEQHAVHAFEIRALDYIVKPFTRARVGKALEVAREYTRQRRINAAAAGLAEIIERREAVEPAARLPLRGRDGLMFVKPDDVEIVRASRNEMVLYTADATHRCRATMTEMRERLGQSFVQVHRSTLVNLNRTHRALLFGGGPPRLKMLSGQEVRVSRAFRANLERRLADSRITAER
jgi:two-component system, LytTR family, response regulator